MALPPKSAQWYQGQREGFVLATPGHAIRLRTPPRINASAWALYLRHVGRGDREIHRAGCNASARGFILATTRSRWRRHSCVATYQMPAQWLRTCDSFDRMFQRQREGLVLATSSVSLGSAAINSGFIASVRASYLRRRYREGCGSTSLRFNASARA